MIKVSEHIPETAHIIEPDLIDADSEADGVGVDFDQTDPGMPKAPPRVFWFL